MDSRRGNGILPQVSKVLLCQQFFAREEALPVLKGRRRIGRIWQMCHE
jgi:hypothetical protein